MANQRATWTWDEERIFESALLTYVEGTPKRWKKIAKLISGKSAKDVEEHYPILLAKIEAMESNITQLQTNTNDASSSQRIEEKEVGSVWDLDELVSCSERTTWTWDEERIFESALLTYVEGTPKRWKKIAKLISGKSAKDVEEHYPILLAKIEAMESNITQLQTNTNDASSSQQRREEKEVGSVWDLDELVSCSEVYHALNKYN
ncbi:PREDICTED: dnaJ homolog subfamily C member 2-like [Ipomoea nil]|uniref:dnaJ homolog subfamily C member 2-like n=1 Tax=Ipomoea nil TaxID=35883 RepID=UPI00090172C4|nr:PREDICTED: dnaJ homolog subfamily C member 2-like [Ipomoea nil]